MIDKKFGRYKYKPHVKNLEVTIPIHTKTHVYFQVKEIRRKFPKLWAYPQVDSILVKMVSPTERMQLQKYDEALEQEKVLDYYLGFTKVFRLLKNCQKPIVGHNILMDLMLLYQNFHQNLPDSYDKFKKELHSIFPIIYDTKHIWININQVRTLKRLNANSGLTTLYELFKNPPGQLKTLYSPCILPSNCKQYVDEDFVHDSGYDAFITGFVFLKICHILAMENSSPSVPMNNAPTFKHLLAAASSFVNKINFPYFSFKYVNLEGADPPPNKTNYLYICPKNPNENLTLDEFNMYFSRYETLEFKFKKLRKAAVVAIINLKLS
ncbi:unnamed protein product [Larinioides sclopetarius]|uniref:Uncharacterized protein n=1 Tax=Larinioides sclopetarius TaxID=280406 RepID=A0AAV1ZZE5_9ARAC